MPIGRSRGNNPEAAVNGRAEWLWRIATVVLAAVLAYAALSARVAVLESRVDSLTEYVREISRDVKTLLQRTQ